MSKETRNITINGNDYHVTIEEKSWRQRVSVYEKSYGRYRKGDAILTNKESKGRLFWFGKDTSSPIDQLIRETLNEAVCIRENKIEKQKEYENKIESAIENVAEIHE